MFKRKRDPKVLNNFRDMPYKIEPEEVPSNMKIHVKFLGKGSKAGSFRFEVNGVVLEGADILSVQRKYIRFKGWEDPNE